MARDTTLQDMFETVLYHNNVKDSGRIAVELHDAYMEWIEQVFPDAMIKAIDESEGVT